MTARTPSPLLGALLFLLFYLAVSPVAGAFSVGDLPLPGSPPAQVQEYLAANTTPSLLTGLLQGVSGLGLAIVVAGPLTRTTATEPARGRLERLGRVAGWVAVAAILTSAILSVVLGLIAETAGTGVVATVRSVSFYAGGVTHVVALGVFVLSISVAHGWSRSVRVVARIAGSLAVLSLLSIAIYYASLFLPLGRLACMVTLVVAGTAYHRARAAVPAAPGTAPW
ncbi:hypothetical protein EXU48_19780 [Occultella glacieicola]|uniref:DUF4386 family protein n=1 Tax=Occultella glacieicola TaxID=2518684 RepID=A0ABY2DYV7_9MICO|nr:hypothetical protein [Occultella glacieicola]TDE89668.1 hypothetical protein EXU48_19780 [Occultella glacieicola]